MYTITDRPKVIGEGYFFRHFFVRDGKPIGTKEIRAYFDRSFVVFKQRLEVFEKEDSFDETEEKELRFMLEALLAAKYLLTTEDK